jgi:pimeloyl-ACP methyl ester carboxylesterase
MLLRVTKKLHSRTITLLESVSPGQEHALVFLHGFPDDPLAWRNQFDYFKKDYAIIAPYAPGVDGIPCKKTPRLDQLTNEYLEIIKQYNFKKVTIIGHDLGGPVAARLLNLDNVFHKAILINGPSIEQMYFRKKDFQQLKKSWYIFLFQIPTLPKKVLKLSWKLMQKQALKDNHIDNPENYHDKLVLEGIDLYRSFFNEVNQLMHQSPNPESKPVDFIWSAKDLYLNIPTKEELDNHFKKYTLEVIEAHHWPQLEQPDLINTLIEKRL